MSKLLPVLKSVMALIPFLVCQAALGQLPETDIFTCEIKSQNGKLQFSAPENITNRRGYDNQPFFMPDGKRLLYVAVPDSSQSDIFSYDFISRRTVSITRTRESEYSPMLAPGGTSISVVRVDADGGQRLYTIPLAKPDSVLLVKGTDSIGYYCWLTDSSLAMFILGNSMTLQVLDEIKNERTLVASDIGRCLKTDPGKRFLYFVIKQNELEWGIFELEIASGVKRKIISTLPGSEDFAILPDGSFLMGSKGRLFRFHPAESNEWMEIADFSSMVGDFYRISVNASGNRMALVAFTGKKP